MNNFTLIISFDFVRAQLEILKIFSFRFNDSRNFSLFLKNNEDDDASLMNRQSIDEKQLWQNIRVLTVEDFPM